MKTTERVMDECVDITGCNMDSDGQTERKELLTDGVWMEGSNNSRAECGNDRELCHSSFRNVGD